ncbi:MAG TPA: hypothetical protein VFL60_01025 [Gaiellaceae bacterium]|nr:hypothetical protein [Gaiellaceae bacterium]
MPLDSRAFTLLLAAWCAAWIGLGVWTGYEVNALRQLSDTVVRAGVAVKSTGDALQRVGGIPLVPGDIGRIGREVSAAGVSAEVNGRASKSTIDTLAVLLGLAVGLIPVGPVVLLFLLLRRTRRG